MVLDKGLYYFMKTRACIIVDLDLNIYLVG